MARGHWDSTKADARKGPRLDHQRDEGVGPSRPRRRRLPDRPQMVLHAEGKRRPSALSRRQCRRIRARHLQGPRHHAPRSAYADRRLRHRQLRHGRQCRPTSMCAANIIREREALQAAIDECYDAGLLGKNNKLGWDIEIYRPSRRRRLYLRRGNRAARKPRGQEGPAAPEAAVPGQYGPLWLPDDGQQRRIDRCCADHPAPRRRLVLGHRPSEQCRHQAVHASPATSTSRARSKRRWASPSAN